MTIKIKVTNEDSRENAIISVKKVTRVNKSNLPLVHNGEELKGGESTEIYVYDSQSVIVEEVRNG